MRFVLLILTLMSLEGAVISPEPDVEWSVTGTGSGLHCTHPADLVEMGRLAAASEGPGPVLLYTPTSKDPLARLDRARRPVITPLRDPVGDKVLDWTHGGLEGCLGDEEALRLFAGGAGVDLPPAQSAALPDYPEHESAWRWYLGGHCCYCGETCGCDDCYCEPF